jgi:hypothetical protein
LFSEFNKGNKYIWEIQQKIIEPIVILANDYNCINTFYWIYAISQNGFVRLHKITD